MTPLAQRIAIAKALGWKQEEQFEDSFSKPTTKVSRGLMWAHPELPVPVRVLPNYLSDLNAMRSAELWLESQNLGDDYLMELGDLTGGSTATVHWFETWTGRTKVAFASCSIRAEAFLRTLSLWEDGSSEPIKP